MPAPTYQRIADDLRRAILDGSLAPGAKLPSRHELARQYGVSDRVAVEAVRVLAAEGFAETRSGSGSYVRQRPEMQRLTRAWYTARRGGSPFRAETGAAGRAGSWECSSERAQMTPAVAARLEAGPGEPAMRTRYTFTADGEPVMLSVSWEPLELTSGTPVMLPEEGPHAGRGVVERMAVIGQQITSAEELVSARPALAAEADRLNMRTGGTVLTICRTYRTDERAVETADIVTPVERYSLVYEIPVGLPHRLVRPPGAGAGPRPAGIGPVPVLGPVRRGGGGPGACRRRPAARPRPGARPGPGAHPRPGARVGGLLRRAGAHRRPGGRGPRPAAVVGPVPVLVLVRRQPVPGSRPAAARGAGSRPAAAAELVGPRPGATAESGPYWRV